MYDQLTSDAQHETRFHAASLFLRYSLVLGSEGEEIRVGLEEFEGATWDAAVACLALSVKVSGCHNDGT